MLKFLFPFIKCIDSLLRLFVKVITFLGIRKPVSSALLFISKVILMFFHLIYFRLTIHGHHHIPKKGGVIIAANHQSYLDPPLVGLSILRKIAFVSKKENFEIPILGPLIELGGSYPIDRKGDEEALNFFADLLKKGHVVVIFPEGTIPAEEDKLRSDVEPITGLLKGKTGAIRLALKTRVPIVPLGISGSGKALCPEAVPKGERLPIPRPVKITMRFGEAFNLSEYYNIPLGREHLRKLSDQLMVRISRLVDHSRNFIPYTVPVSEETYKIFRAFEAGRKSERQSLLKK